MLSRRPIIMALAAIIAPALLGAGAESRAPTLLVRVIDSAAKQPLVNAEVIDLTSKLDRFTNEQGEARLPWPAGNRLHLRVRQIGFRFADRELVRDTTSASEVDTVTFTLPRVQYVLPDVVTKATTHCVSDADAASQVLSIAVLDQLRLSAERYEAFRREYPFHLNVLRRTINVGADGRARSTAERNEGTDSEQWTERYTPGSIVDRGKISFSIPILFLEALADPIFWERHCFVVRGVEARDSSRVVRMEFTVAPKLKDPDWEGSVLVDSATSVLKRVDFKLAGLRDDDVPRRYEGYTTFMSPSPFIVMPESTVAMWWRSRGPVNGNWGMPDVAQMLLVWSVKYRKSAPPGANHP